MGTGLDHGVTMGFGLLTVRHCIERLCVVGQILGTYVLTERMAVSW